MEDDPLAKYRRKPLAPGETRTVAQAPEAYAAFAGKDKVERLVIHRNMDPTRSPRYLYLKDIAYDGPFGTNFALYFEFMVVIVRGKNLQPVILALQKDAADFIQEFDPDRWAMPTDSATPLIASIEIVEAESTPPVAGAEIKEETKH